MINCAVEERDSITLVPESLELETPEFNQSADSLEMEEDNEDAPSSVLKDKTNSLNSQVKNIRNYFKSKYLTWISRITT